MKCSALIIFVLTLYQLKLYVSLKGPPKQIIIEFSQCNVCFEMFKFDFNFEQLEKDQVFTQLKSIIKDFSSQFGGLTLNMEAVAKDVAMKYFSKNDDKTLKDFDQQCKVTKAGVNLECDSKKNGFCDKLLSLKDKQCSDIIKSKKEKAADSSKDISMIMNTLNNNSNENGNNQLSMQNSQQASINNENNPLEHLSRIINQESDKFLGNPNSNPSNNNYNSANQTNQYFGNSNLPISNKNYYQQSSLLEISPPAITDIKPTQFNFKEPNHQWTPPKPIVLDNFQDNLGTQLKEISYLTNEIAKYESKLKILKQQLSNKLVIAQNSYNMVQKALTQISSFIQQTSSQPKETQNQIRFQQQINEDDWDEASKFFK